MTDRAELKFGISAEHTSVLLSVMGACNFVGKIVFGAILDKFRPHALHLTAAVLLQNSVSIFVGHLYDVTSSYTSGFLLDGGLSLLGMSLIPSAICVQKETSSTEKLNNKLIDLILI